MFKSFRATSRRSLVFVCVLLLARSAQGEAKVASPEVHLRRRSAAPSCAEIAIRYYVGAKQGQTMSVKITSLEDNAVFQIFLPGEQEALSGAGERMTR